MKVTKKIFYQKIKKIIKKQMNIKFIMKILHLCLKELAQKKIPLLNMIIIKQNQLQF
jgi:hypothetical protein